MAGSKSSPVCPAIARHHPRYCAWVDPDSEGYRRSGAEAILAIARQEAIPSPTRAFPSLWTQTANLAGAVGRFVASGGERATAELQAERLAICSGCPEFVEGRCLRCGCRLNAKVLSAAEHCPLVPPRW